MSLFSLRSIDPERLARMIATRRVERGICWLNWHAPLNWWRNMFDIHPEGWSFRVGQFSNHSVIALAFETRADLASKANHFWGYVTEETVLEYFKEGREFLRFHGFFLSQKDILGIGITDFVLAITWHKQIIDVARGATHVQHLSAGDFVREKVLV